nr:MAG TPA: hypothetical protein [Bacteriophage sp.]
MHWQHNCRCLQASFSEIPVPVLNPPNSYHNS